MNDFINYCKNLGSTNPTPGGGSAAALTLSLAASCTEKAARFSLENQNSQEIITFSTISEAGIKLSHNDQIAFENWQCARKLPKRTEEEKKIRDEQINFYTTEATVVPHHICKNALILLQEIKKFLPQCTKFLISDLGVGASLAAAAFESGIYNIMINLPYLKDIKFQGELKEYIKNETLLCHQLKKEILDYCNEKLSNH